MYNPGACRFHYGHPDVWRRSFVSTCGGVSKPNKSQHVSEDVFGGYNVTLRGREIKYVDFIAVGKGRDMGFETINTFEAEIAAGNGEQVLSRDVRRLAHNMSFSRLLTRYHTGNGFFINTALNMVSVHTSLWAYLLLALGKSSNAQVQATLSSVQLLQLGTLSVLVYLFTLGLEIGLLRALWTIIRHCRLLAAGSLMFYIFRAQTSAYSFTYDLLFGGAKYLPTGRGYKLAPTSFKVPVQTLWTITLVIFGGAATVRSGLCGIWVGSRHELAGAVGTAVSGVEPAVWALLVHTICLQDSDCQGRLAPDANWLNSPSPNPALSWTAWNAESWRSSANADGKQSGRFGAVLRAVVFKLPSIVMMFAAMGRMKGGTQGLPSYLVAMTMAGATIIGTVFVLLSRRVSAMSGLRYQFTRVFSILTVSAMVIGLILSGALTSHEMFSNIRVFSDTALVAFATVLLLRLLPLVYYLPTTRSMRGVCSAVYRVADIVLTYFLNGLRFVLSLFDILTGLQAQLLFNTAYARTGDGRHPAGVQCTAQAGQASTEAAAAGQEAAAAAAVTSTAAGTVTLQKTNHA